MNNWKIKLFIFKILSIFPESIGNLLYFFLQNIKGSLNADSTLISTKETLKNFEKIISKDSNIDIKSVAELGSGWFPSLPYILVREKQIKKVESFDLNEFYSKGRIKSINKIYNLNSSNPNNLINEVKYHPYSDLSKVNLNKDINFMISRHVLEHIEPEIIKNIHMNFINQIGEHHVLHYVSPSDHRSYSDKSILLHDFLKYNEIEWQNLYTRFDYHNRLRLPEYRKIFLDLGYNIIYENYGKGKEGYISKFKKLNLDKRFLKYEDYENIAGNLIFFMKHNGRS